MQVCTSLLTDSHASSPPLCFFIGGCPSCRPTSSVKALKATTRMNYIVGRPTLSNVPLETSNGIFVQSWQPCQNVSSWSKVSETPVLRSAKETCIICRPGSLVERGNLRGGGPCNAAPFISFFDHWFVKVTSEPSVNEDQLYRRPQRRRRSAALSTPPAVHVHIGSGGPTSNGTISSLVRLDDARRRVGQR